jgi:hypothetical protein
MNKYIIILILIILIVIFFINKKKEHYSAESLSNVFAPCKDIINGTVNFNNINISGELKLGGVTTKNMTQYLLEILFPYGSFYVQYPDKNSNYDSDQFPINKSPGRLFGGDWQEQWPEESIFFRTRGTEASENRVNGFQNDALKMFVGKSAFNQTNYRNPGIGNTGIFGGGVSIQKMGTDYGSGSDVGHVDYFDSATQSNTSELETRVRNRQIKIWKRIRKQNNNTMPNLPENKHDSEYDNIYYDGPYPNNTFVTTKNFDSYDKINTYQKAFEKCKQMGDLCKAVGMTNGNPNNPNNIYYSSDAAVIYNDEGDNGTYKVWYKKKDENVL